MLGVDQTPALSHRVALCKQLARAVSDVHGIKLVHKSIRPRSILVVGQYQWERSSQSLVLTDWTLVREFEGASHWVGEDDWQRAIYQHPTRQGLQAESKYTIKHDIYSLGVCMLEMLLWQPFIVKSNPEAEDSPKAISEHFQRRAISLGADQGIPERYFGDSRTMTKKPAVVRRVMVDWCRTELPACAGNKLKQVVMDCLCCLDANGGTGPEASEINDLESGLDYIGDVVVALNSVSV
jgi:serine/threonine protein kinase